MFLRGRPAVALLLLLWAAWMYLPDLGRNSLWEDELFSADIVLQRPLWPQDQPWLQRVRLTQLGLQESFWTVKAADQSPPLYELLNKLVTTLLGDGEAQLRLLSALAVLMLLGWLGLRVWRQARQPEGMAYLAMMGLLASSGFVHVYAQEARAYGLGMALSAVLWVLFWERWLHGWRSAPLPGWAETTLFAAAALTHYHATALAALLLGLYGLEGLRRRDGWALLRMACVLAVVLAWLALSYHSLWLTAQGQMGFVQKMPYGQALLAGLRTLHTQVLGPWAAAGMALCVVLYGIALLRQAGAGAARPPLTPTQRRWAWASLAVLLTLLAYGALITATMRQSQIVAPRHYVFLLPPLYLLLACALADGQIGRQQGRQPWLGALAPLMLVGLMGLQWPMLQHYRHIPKHDFRAAAQFALQHLQPGDAVYTGFMLNPAGYRYYLQRKADKPVRILPLYSTEDAQALCRQAPLPQRFAHLHMAYHPAVAQALQQACGAHFEVLRHERHNVSAGLWRQKP